MNLVKVSSSGQITLPKVFRQKYGTNFYSYRISGDQLIVIPASVQQFNQVNPQIVLPAPKKKQSLVQHLQKGIFKSKHPEVNNLSEKIDEVVYR